MTGCGFRYEGGGVRLNLLLPFFAFPPLPLLYLALPLARSLLPFRLDTQLLSFLMGAHSDLLTLITESMMMIAVVMMTVAAAVAVAMCQGGTGQVRQRTTGHTSPSVTGGAGEKDHVPFRSGCCSEAKESQDSRFIFSGVTRGRSRSKGGNMGD